MMPSPTLTTVPLAGASLAESGRTIPPAVTSSDSSRFTTIRSPNGCNLPSVSLPPESMLVSGKHESFNDSLVSLILVNSNQIRVLLDRLDCLLIRKSRAKTVNTHRWPSKTCRKGFKISQKRAFIYGGVLVF